MATMFMVALVLLFVVALAAAYLLSGTRSNRRRWPGEGPPPPR